MMPRQYTNKSVTLTLFTPSFKNASEVIGSQVDSAKDKFKMTPPRRIVI